MSSKGKHMTLSDRAVIETGINSGSDKSSIAKTIGKSKSAVGKEIAAHREASYRCSLPLHQIQIPRLQGRCGVKELPCRLKGGSSADRGFFR